MSSCGRHFGDIFEKGGPHHYNAMKTGRSARAWPILIHSCVSYTWSLSSKVLLLSSGDLQHLDERSRHPQARPELCEGRGCCCHNTRTTYQVVPGLGALPAAKIFSRSPWPSRSSSPELVRVGVGPNNPRLAQGQLFVRTLNEMSSPEELPFVTCAKFKLRRRLAGFKSHGSGALRPASFRGLRKRLALFGRYLVVPDAEAAAATGLYKQAPSAATSTECNCAAAASAWANKGLSAASRPPAARLAQALTVRQAAPMGTGRLLTWARDLFRSTRSQAEHRFFLRAFASAVLLRHG